LVVGGSNTSRGIPAGCSLETSLFTSGAAASNDVVSLNDIEEGALGVGGGLIEPGVQETEGGLVGVQSLFIQQRDDASEGGGRGRSSTNGFDTSVLNDLEVDVTESAGVGGSTVGSVERARGRQFNTGVEVGIDCGLLRGLVGQGELLRESTSGFETDLGTHDSLFGSSVSADETGGSDGSDVRAGGRERGIKSAFARSFTKTISFTTGSRITAGKDDTDSSSTSFLELGVQAFAVRIRRVIALRTVADGVNPRGAGLVRDLGRPNEEVVPESVALEGVEPGRDVGDNTHDVLNVKAGFISGVSGDVGSDHFRDVLVRGIGDKLFPEALEVSNGVVFGLELGDSSHIVGICLFVVG